MKKNIPLISVVMPAYNAQKYISPAIKSILDQTFSKFELIIIDDSSTDNTRAIIQSFSKKDSRIKLLTNSSSHNIATILNMGIDAAQSNIIARMDADDIALPNRLELQYKLIHKSKKIAVVGANIIIIDTSGKEIATRKYPQSSKELKRCLFRYSPFAHPVVCFRKDMFEEVGRYNPKYSPTEDLDLWFRLGKKYRFDSVPDFLLQYRVYEKSSSHKIIKELEKLVFEIRIQAITKHGYRPSVYDVSYNVLQFITLWVTPAKLRIALYNTLRNNDLI
jgi:glycosyltransferase involved in cell wall biosynthesis